jgi:hypothetical protein
MQIGTRSKRKTDRKLWVVRRGNSVSQKPWEFDFPPANAAHCSVWAIPLAERIALQ